MRPAFARYAGTRSLGKNALGTSSYALRHCAAKTTRSAGRNKVRQSLFTLTAASLYTRTPYTFSSNLMRFSAGL